MSDNYIEEDLQSNDFDGEQDPNDIKSLRRAANSKKQLEKELADAKRELAFAKAGISLDDPKMKYFIKGYDGELSVTAVRQAALEGGFLEQRQPDPVQEQASAAESRVMQASAGAILEDTTEQAALSRLQNAMEEGGIDAMLDVARQYGIPIGSEM